jgi:hypothetical protein
MPQTWLIKFLCNSYDSKNFGATVALQYNERPRNTTDDFSLKGWFGKHSPVILKQGCFLKTGFFTHDKRLLKTTANSFTHASSNIIL